MLPPPTRGLRRRLLNPICRVRFKDEYETRSVADFEMYESEADYIREQNVKIYKERAMKVFSEKGNREPFALLDQMRLLLE